jgi:hypothetical protein
MAYLQDFYQEKTADDTAAIVNKYAREHLDMTADVNIINDKERKPEYQISLHEKKILQIPRPRRGRTTACRRLHVSPM